MKLGDEKISSMFSVLGRIKSGEIHPVISVVITQATISKVIDNVLKIHILIKIGRAVRDVTIPVRQYG